VELPVVRFKQCFKIVFFFGVETGFGAAISDAVLCFATQSLQIALQWLRQGWLVPRLCA